MVKTLLLLGSLALAGCQVAEAKNFPTQKATEVELHEKLPDNGALTIKVGPDSAPYGWYIIDTRFDICLYQTTQAVIKISCKPFENLHGNE